ncbi:hypothetical protein F7Q99_26020 [Streptomyces kaniharaensis]|uniref:Uncharacterized protein n=1 Tax=Streptomyces kaniharaensis TaxID=212423 RepID=A0A6N7L1G2_9ACTN|nr:hypothetical protein [Streptomyces kaniharaensis]MQS15633.1 hypothetical protein [Streptomyces kaniharaensis]
MTTGDSSDLVAMVVQALVQAASNTVGAAGAALGSEAVARVREGLRRAPHWAQAAGQVDATPGDPQAQQALARAVGELLGWNPGLAANLRARLSVVTTEPPPPQDAPVTVIGGGNRTSGQTAMGTNNTVAGGNIRTTHRHGSVAGLIGVLVAVAALVALGIHLNSGSSQDLGMPGGGLAAAPLTNTDQVRSVLPDLHAVPAGWRESRAPTAEPPSDCKGSGISAAEADLCSQSVASGTVTYRTADEDVRVQFRIVAGPSPLWADKAYDLIQASFTKGPSADPVAVPAVGDRSSAHRDGRTTGVLVKVGSTVLMVTYAPTSTDPRAAERVTPLARMFATRSQQAQTGRTPDASVQ